MDRQLPDVIKNWPKEPRESAERLVRYYGAPNEYSASKLVWYNTKDSRKRTELSRDETPHDFPAHHSDFLEQFIDYKVPIKMYSKLAAFDGSVICERTKGEISARCGGTSMNFVAINLAHDIVSGKRTVEEARAEYTRATIERTKTARNRPTRRRSSLRCRRATPKTSTSRRCRRSGKRRITSESPFRGRAPR